VLSLRYERVVFSCPLRSPSRREIGRGQRHTLAASPPAASANDEVQGVFVVRQNKAIFVPVETGISGVSDIEVTGGLQEGDTIVTGSYKSLRTLRSAATVKVDNSAPKFSGENPS
jgi:HlyD family secretion protein